MNLVIGIVVFVFAIVCVLYVTEAGRYAKTVWLIQQIEPYEQTGGGAGTILVIGDSTGYGTGASAPAESVPGRVGALLPEYQIENNSVNAREINGAVEVVTTLTSTYDLVLLQIGANDLLAKRPVSEVVNDMEQLVQQALAHAEYVVVLTAGNIGAVPNYSGVEAEYYETVSREYDALMRLQFQAHENVHFVSLFDEPENDPFVAEPKKFTSIDGLHPTSAGYGIWFAKAQPYIVQSVGPVSEE